MYEEYHRSPLSELLISRSLKNPYVVGAAFFWGLKSNMYAKVSYERFHVLVEQFLLLCGKYLDELWIQTKVNEGLMKVSLDVVEARYGTGLNIK